MVQLPKFYTIINHLKYERSIYQWLITTVNSQSYPSMNCSEKIISIGALKDVVPPEWSEDVLSGKTKVIIGLPECPQSPQSPEIRKSTGTVSVDKNTHSHYNGNRVILVFHRHREKRGCDTQKIIQAAITYWVDLKSNIFKNYVDALFSIIPLVILPAGSLFPTLFVTEVDFWNYIFPIFCISIAGTYDAYGRMEKEKSKNLKLGIRVALNSIVLLLLAILLNYGKGVRWIPSVILTICGIMLLREIWQRIVTSIQNE